MKSMIEALRQKYQADVNVLLANIQIYLKSPAGVADHPEISSSLDILLGKLSEADGKLQMLSKYAASIKTNG